MKIQLFHKTTDLDLLVVQMVCGQNQEGEWLLTGAISEVYGDHVPKLYRIESFGGLYSADELKLVS